MRAAVGVGVGWSCGCCEFGGGFGARVGGEGFAVGVWCEDEAALKGVGDERDVWCVAGAVEVEDEVVGEAGGEDQGAPRRAGRLGFEQAGDEALGSVGRRGGGTAV